MAQVHAHTVEHASFAQVSPPLIRYGGIAAVLGLAGALGLGLAAGDGLAPFFHSYLLALFYFLTLSFGALFFVLVQHLTRAGWSVGVRRIAEVLANNLPALVLLILPLLVPALLGNSHLFPWADVKAVQADPLLRAKQAYLNVPFFAVRWALYLAVFTFLPRFFLRLSRLQDSSGDARLTKRMQQVAAPGTFVFALGVTFCSFDLLMSLEPHFFSTIFGVYIFAGSCMAFYATTIIIAQLMENVGALRGVLTVEHYHDMGKFLFGFVFFWGYIGFSQYMLYWYGNIPEETEWFLERQSGQWVFLSLSLLFGHFLIPFPGLLSRHVKRSRVGLAFWAVYMLVMHWVDLYWLVMPSLGHGVLPLSPIDLLAFVGIGGVAVANFGWTARGLSAVPARDPRLSESLAFENA